MNLEKLTDYLDSLIDKGIPSFDCSVYENHKMIYRHMGGSPDQNKAKEMSGDEQYLMYSMTKVQTMTALLQLVEQGKISLEDNVDTYLPVYKNIMVKDNGEIRYTKNPMKIKHLLSMQSGLDYNLERQGIINTIKNKGQNATTRDFVNSFVETPLLFDPGTHFFYSLSHDVVAAIIEIISDMSFGEYLNKNIWQPLEMNNTFFAKPMNDNIKNLAAQYICDDDEKIQLTDSGCAYQLNDCYESGGAGLISCTNDYALFGDAIACGGVSQNGIRIIKSESVELMKENLLSEVSRKDLAESMGRKGYGYGCGVQILLEPELIQSSATKGIFGWDGAAGSCLIMDTQRKRSLVYAQHVRNCGMAYEQIHPMIRDFVFEK